MVERKVTQNESPFNFNTQNENNFNIKGGTKGGLRIPDISENSEA